MQTIVNFFESIGNFISSAIDFLISSIQDIVYLIRLLGKTLIAIPSYFRWLPVQLIAPLTLIFTVVVLYKILGRDG